MDDNTNHWPETLLRLAETDLMYLGRKLMAIRVFWGFCGGGQFQLRQRNGKEVQQTTKVVTLPSFVEDIAVHTEPME